MFDVWWLLGGLCENLLVVIFWYGGGWVYGDCVVYVFVVCVFVKVGFVVVVLDYCKVFMVCFLVFL